MDVTTMCKEEEETEEDNNMSPSKTSQRTTTMTTINMTGYVIGEKEGAFVKTTTTYANLSKSILPSHHCRRTTSSSPFSSPFCRSSSILHLLLFLLTSLLAADLSCAGFSCLTHCNCFYKSNKLLADCGAQGLQFLPQVREKRGEISDRRGGVNQWKNETKSIRKGQEKGVLEKSTPIKESEEREMRSLDEGEE